jgi:hypothetical protein
LRGYNKGDAHFVDIVEGTYYLRIKSESGRTAKYSVNYCCDVDIKLEEYFVKP